EHPGADVFLWCRVGDPSYRVLTALLWTIRGAARRRRGSELLHLIREMGDQAGEEPSGVGAFRRSILRDLLGGLACGADLCGGIGRLPRPLCGGHSMSSLDCLARSAPIAVLTCFSS